MPEDGVAGVPDPTLPSNLSHMKNKGAARSPNAGFARLVPAQRFAAIRDHVSGCRKFGGVRADRFPRLFSAET
jgi:hypothetical protein